MVIKLFLIFFYHPKAIYVMAQSLICDGPKSYLWLPKVLSVRAQSFIVLSEGPVLSYSGIEVIGWTGVNQDSSATRNEATSVYIWAVRIPQILRFRYNIAYFWIGPESGFFKSQWTQ